MDPINSPDLVSAQDDFRTKRAFIGLLSAAIGLGDQQDVSVDGYAVNQPFRYQSIGPTGVGVEGLPVSTAQGAGSSAAGVSPALLIGGLVLAALVLPRLLRG